MSFFKNLFSSKKEEPEQPEVLLEDRCHSCPITAIVEQDSRVAYFYLWSDKIESFGTIGTKSCWIRNLKQAPEQRETTKGVPPMLIKATCKFPAGQERLKKENLRIVWFEEGDGAALLENDDILAIIPGWGGEGGFYGYSRDCIGQGELAWEISSENIMPSRIQKAKEFIDSWDNESNPFQTLQPEILKVYDDQLGKNDKYFAIDGNNWPPKGLYLKVGETKHVLATVAVSLRPMPIVERHFENPEEHNRIELGLILSSTFPQAKLQGVAEWISAQTNIPWDSITWLGEGHTINFDAFGHDKFKAVVLANNLKALPKLDFPIFRDSKIKMLWMIPISQRERNYIMKNGSSSFFEKLDTIGDSIFSLDREELNV